MRTNYDDITDRLGPPIWYSSMGVPRYEKFSPEQCDPYHAVIALMRIACQDCDKIFLVATGDYVGFVTNRMVPPKPLPTDQPLETDDPWEFVGSFDYGDPPMHGCVGDSMSSIPQEILEYWVKKCPEDQIVWYRDPQYEFVIPTYKRNRP